MNKKQKLSPRVQILVVIGAVVVVLLGGYFLLVAPQKQQAAALSKKIDATQAQILQARALSRQSRRVQPIRVASLFRLTKAMPDEADMAGILLQLNLVASQAGISFDSIKPAPAVVLVGYQAVPITIQFTGSYYGLVDFLLRLRGLVDVQRNGELSADGRLFAVDTLAFTAASTGFPQITAVLVVDAFVYGTGAPATSATAGATTTTSTGTTATPGATPPSTGASAAGGTG